MTLSSGRSMAMTRRRVHLRAGQSFVIQVVPQHPCAHVEVSAEPPLQTVVRVNRVEGGPVPSYHAEFAGHSFLRIVPIPTTGRLRVTVIDGLPAPCRITIPITVWPSHSTFVLWWVLAFLSIVGLRWQRIVADRERFGDILDAMGKDLPHLFGLLALGFLIVIPLRVIGWLVSLAEPVEGSD
jgi:hypothetical protein